MFVIIIANYRLTGNSEQNNQAFARKQQQNIHATNGLSRGNIAAVEPYNHVPLQPNHQVRGINNTQEVGFKVHLAFMLYI